MGNYTIFQMFENPSLGGRQARDFTTNVPKILDLISSSEQIFSENCRWVPLLSDEGQAVDTEVLKGDRTQSCFRMAQLNCYELRLLIT